MENLTELDDILGSILNRILIAKVLIKQIPKKPEYRQYLDTLPEKLGVATPISLETPEDSQKIIDEYCVVNFEGNDKAETEISYLNTDSDTLAD